MLRAAAPSSTTQTPADSTGIACVLSNRYHYCRIGQTPKKLPPDTHFHPKHKYKHPAENARQVSSINGAFPPCLYKCTHTYSYIDIHTCIDTYVYIYIYICVCVCVYIRALTTGHFVVDPQGSVSAMGLAGSLSGCLIFGSLARGGHPKAPFTENNPGYVQETDCVLQPPTSKMQQHRPQGSETCANDYTPAPATALPEEFNTPNSIPKYWGICKRIPNLHVPSTLPSISQKKKKNTWPTPGPPKQQLHQPSISRKRHARQQPPRNHPHHHPEQHSQSTRPSILQICTCTVTSSNSTPNTIPKQHLRQHRRLHAP